MEFKQIQELVKLINKSNLSELQVEQDNFKIIIKKEQKTDEQHVASSIQTIPVVNPAMHYPSGPAPSAESTPQTAENKEKKEKSDDHLITIKSPMIGTFYRSSSPDKPVFANVGDDVAPGKVVCIIEAMKLFNEVESEVSGKIVKILVDDASPVEYDQPLFLVEPLSQDRLILGHILYK